MLRDDCYGIEAHFDILDRRFEMVQQHGGVAEAEMHRVFNCGIGMTLIVAEKDVATAQRLLAAAGESVYRIGRIEARAPGQARTVVV